MRAFLLYVDDWLASKQIKQMDAIEEVGYLHLLLAEVTEEDCGLPADENQLALLSGLGSQWKKPTKDKSKRIEGLTSGSKIMKSFFLRDGRWFNARLLKEWNYQREVVEKRRYASSLAAVIRSSHDNPYDDQVDGHVMTEWISDGSPTQTQTQTSSSTQLSSSEWPETEKEILERFPATDPAMVRRIIECGVQAHVGTSTNGLVLTDIILAGAVKKATARKQWGPALYLKTLPIVVANDVRMYEREHKR